ncbi:M14 family zinc carboxypeptidase [Hwangdonia lutea]|uniref:M14 family zinc carboxypeptidase n=1 Tax=Hwangdonia lutea TaxID=3075823 RepID=A0AA97ELK8_9FLAO|nr:M14 family zinc carboxypeptidase [Hwangdonia sp. SCSIO 19198]WOD43387.1 M14 family zinc carboxypeptidase [Hwangdonia sp. SCSIO 19198]
MNVAYLKSLFLTHKESSLHHRYITNLKIEPLLNDLEKKIDVHTLGKSVLGKPIYALKIGKGEKRILMWSQMHGNESTTTKALFDLLNTLLDKNTALNSILKACTLYIIPILNPDGAEAYTRVNANAVDLNRDAQDLSQPESKVLRGVFNHFKPHFCYNLHGQRTIFSAGKTNKSATVSFLAPAQDKNCTITANRKIAMEVIGVMNKVLQNIIPNQVGVYDDAFNLNCVGDTFQSENVPTILFEAGHFKGDYAREITREYIYMTMLKSLEYIANNKVDGSLYKPYFDIPENEKCFFDVIIRNAKTSDNRVEDIAIMYHEKLIDGKIEFIPKIEKIEKLTGFYGHKEFDANNLVVLDLQGEGVKVGNENDFVMIDNSKIALF